MTRMPIGPALSDHLRSYSADELADALRRAAEGMLKLSEGRTRPVAIMAENRAEVLIAHTAGCLAGVATVAVNPRLTGEELAYVLTDSGAGAVITDGSAGETGLPTVALEAGVPGIAWDGWLASCAAAEPDQQVPPAFPIVYTSGTTGRPKGTKMISARPGPTVETFVAAQRAGAAASADGPHLVVGPLHHASPLVAVRYILAGTPVVILPKFGPEQMLQAIDRFKVASTMVVPTHLSRLLKLPPDVRSAYDVSSLRWVCHTGAPCPPSVKRAGIEWLGPVVMEVYGSSESGVISMITSEEWLAKPGSVGRVARRYEPIVVGDDGSILPPGSVGKLYFRDRTGRGIVYEGDPEKTRQAHLEPGVFSIGEIGYVDHDGYLFISDREASLILTGGTNVYPAEIEQVLVEHPKVADAVCVGVPHEDLGEVVHALVQPEHHEDPPTLDELLEFCGDRLARYKHPRSLEIVAVVERDAMGKVNRRRIRERAISEPA